MAATLDKFIGQEEVSEEIAIELEACRRKQTRWPHTLVTGPAGTGKTFLANIIATETDSAFSDINSPLVKDIFDDVFEDFEIQEVLKHATGRDILVFKPRVVFFDEAHTLTKDIQSILLKMMLEGMCYVDGLWYDLRSTSFILATTDPDKLLAPLRMRCALQFHLRRYTVTELTNMFMKMEIEDGGELQPIHLRREVAHAIARRSRFIPRIGKLLYFERIYSLARNMSDTPEEAEDNITLELVEGYFKRRRINSIGLNPTDFEYLRTLANAPKPMGVKTIAAQMEINEATVQKDIEPFLKYLKYIQYSKTGREITPTGKQALKAFDDELVSSQSEELSLV